MISIIVDKIENLYTPSIIAEAISPICRKLSFQTAPSKFDIHPCKNAALLTYYRAKNCSF